MLEYLPSKLPDVDFVEVLDLRRVNANRVTNYLDGSQHVSGIQCDAVTAELIVNAWRLLPVGDSARCHTPPFGVRFTAEQKVYLQASICWRCHNMFGLLDETQFKYAFDSESGPAKQLFEICKSVIGVNDG